MELKIKRNEQIITGEQGKNVQKRNGKWILNIKDYQKFSTGTYIQDKVAGQN